MWMGGDAFLDPHSPFILNAHQILHEDQEGDSQQRIGKGYLSSSRRNFFLFYFFSKPIKFLPNNKNKSCNF